jgi:hypothetical protein
MLDIFFICSSTIFRINFERAKSDNFDKFWGS